MKLLRFFLWIVVFVAVLVGVAEWYLSRQGFAVEAVDGCREYDMFDPYLGWVVRPGSSVSYEADGETGVRENVWPDTSRVSRPTRDKQASKRVLLVGCSHTYGMGVPDEATFAWKLNKRFPDICFDNFGVPAYGTYQCYLREKQQLLMHPDYDLVLYCAVIDHLSRNTIWQVHIGDIERKRYYVMDPRVDLDERGELRFYEPFRRWLGDDMLLSINFAKRVYYCRLIEQSEQKRTLPELEKTAAFWELNRLMDEQAEKNGAKYGLVWLDSENSWDDIVIRTQNLRADNPWNNPRYADKKYPSVYNCCTHLRNSGDPALHLGNNPTAHYNEKVHNLWAKAIGDWVEILLREGDN